MRAELQKLYSGLDAMSREELVLSFRRLIEECSEKDARLEIAGSAATEMSRQFQQIKDENAALKKENKELLRQNRKLTDQLRMRSRDLFGRSSEQTSGIVDAILDEKRPSKRSSNASAGSAGAAERRHPASAGKTSASSLQRPTMILTSMTWTRHTVRATGGSHSGGRKTRSSPSIPSSTTNVRIVPLSLSGWSTAL